MAKANAELQAKFDDLKARHDKTLAELAKAGDNLVAMRAAMESERAAAQAVREAAAKPVVAPPKGAVMTLVYSRRQTEGPPAVFPHKPGGCILVPAFEGAQCPNCGWVYFGEHINDLEPHLMGPAPIPEPVPKPYDPPPAPPYLPPYHYAGWECPPVHRVKGATCPKCGWIFAGIRPEDHEPHPTIP